jgi:hypothetical protein
MSAAPSAHARILDFFMTMLPLRAGVPLRRGTAPLPKPYTPTLGGI